MSPISFFADSGWKPALTRRNSEDNRDPAHHSGGLAIGLLSMPPPRSAGAATAAIDQVKTKIGGAAVSRARGSIEIVKFEPSHRRMRRSGCCARDPVAGAGAADITIVRPQPEFVKKKSAAPQSKARAGIRPAARLRLARACVKRTNAPPAPPATSPSCSQQPPPRRLEQVEQHRAAEAKNRRAKFFDT